MKVRLTGLLGYLQSAAGACSAFARCNGRSATDDRRDAANPEQAPAALWR